MQPTAKEAANTPYNCSLRAQLSTQGEVCKDTGCSCQLGAFPLKHRVGVAIVDATKDPREATNWKQWGYFQTEL